MSRYEIVRSRHAYLVHDTATGDLIQTRKKREAEAWIAHAEARDEMAPYWEALNRKTRLDRVQAYLAQRALRPPRPVQLELPL
jgi:hypothetical protein